jgi:hypothetical protein
VDAVSSEVVCEHTAVSAITIVDACAAEPPANDPNFFASALGGVRHLGAEGDDDSGGLNDITTFADVVISPFTGSGEDGTDHHGGTVRAFNVREAYKIPLPKC